VPEKIGTVAIVGVGLIGGSFALALKNANLVDRVIGIGRRQSSVDAALKLGVIDEAATDLSAAGAAHLVLLAMPVGQMEPTMRAIAPHVRAGAIITDAGSTKQDVVACARQHLGRALPRFVPAHPIAGAEQSGVEAARVNLYRDRDVILTPLTETDSSAAHTVAQLWRACGAKVSEMSPAQHDEIFGAVSHLPHLVAYALVNMLAKRSDGTRLLSFAGAGFRDFTRIASSSPEMWRDIALANRAVLQNELTDLQQHLDGLRELLRSGDGAGVERIFSDARAARQDWLKRKGYAQE
jgi:prephenate dehydrogenase